MKTLLSLPPNLVEAFHDVTGLDQSQFLCTSDPVGHRVGSGGGTVWALQQTAAMGSRCILLHAGGQSRRLPAYAPSGKVLTPLPALHGEPVGLELLHHQLPLYNHIMEMAPESLRLLIASGDALITASDELPTVPEADLVCYGIPATPERLALHGVYAMPKSDPTHLDFMLQKPSLEKQQVYADSHILLLDIGIWLLSERAIARLTQCATDEQGNVQNYDLYSDFGRALGMNPTYPDERLKDLSVAILPLPEGRFLHFGTTPDLIGSTEILTGIPNPDMIWVENSYTDGWSFTQQNVVTGIPANDWKVSLSCGQCVDMVPMGDSEFALRPYGFNDAFRGSLDRPDTLYLGMPYLLWAAAHSVPVREDVDIQKAQLFPVTSDMNLLGRLLKWMLESSPSDNSLADTYLSLPRVSADEISDRANLRRLVAQRQELLHQDFDSKQAFAHLRQTIMEHISLPVNNVGLSTPKHGVLSTAPLRMDLSGGWTDTPPFCLYDGGAVVNVAVNLDGRPPLSCRIVPTQSGGITLRSIDLHAEMVVTDESELQDYAHLNDMFSIPKAALVLAGIKPTATSGFLLEMESCVPAGSGMGTSSILAATVLDAISAAFELGWDNTDICQLTLVLEQMLTAGGGWQDQWGGVVGGAKILQTEAGVQQVPQVEQLPLDIWTNPELAPLHLLYFTGLTRTAKDLLGQIVLRMFLREPVQRKLLSHMKVHASNMAQAIRFAQQAPVIAYSTYCDCLAENWRQNKQLDAGSCPPAVQKIIDLVGDDAAALKLPGAGGGGFLYICARDLKAANDIRERLEANPQSPTARFYELSVSREGLHHTFL